MATKLLNTGMYSQLSRLRNYSIIIDEQLNAARLGLKDNRFVVALKKCLFQHYNIEAKYEYRPDLISHKFYNTPELWWVIFEYNEFKHPFNDFYVDRLIMIPRYDQFVNLLIL
jgi:hypothetical protein